MGDVAEILGLQSKPTSVYDETIKLLNEKPKGLNAGPKLNKKPKGMSREVFSLIGADSLVPTMQGNKPNVAFKSKRLNAIKGKWIWNSFTNSSRNDEMKLHHWVKADIQYNDYPYCKFNIKQQLITYTDEEYELLLVSNQWTKEETAHLLHLVSIYGPRWPIITDRYDLQPYKSSEDLQDRYYNIITRLRQHRSNNNSSDINNYDHNTAFNYEHEKRRRYQLEISYRKSKEEEIEETQLREELKTIDMLIRRAKKNTKPVVTSTVDTSIVADNIPPSLPEYKQLSAAEIHPSNVVTTVIDYPIPGKPFLQSGRLIVNETSLKLSKNLIKKVNTLLRDLGLLEFPIPTKMVCDYYDSIRQQAVSLISIHSIIKQKEKDLQLLRSKQNIALGSLNPFTKEIKIPLSHQIVTLPTSQLSASNSNISSYPNVLHQQVLPNEGDLVSSLGVGMILAETYNPSLSLQDTSSPNNTSKKSSKRKLPTDATANEGDGNNNDAAKKSSKKSKKTVVKPVVSNESNDLLATSQSDVVVTAEPIKEPVDIKPIV